MKYEVKSGFSKKKEAPLTAREEPLPLIAPQTVKRYDKTKPKATPKTTNDAAATSKVLYQGVEIAKKHILGSDAEIFVSQYKRDGERVLVLEERGVDLLGISREYCYMYLTKEEASELVNKGLAKYWPSVDSDMRIK